MTFTIVESMDGRAIAHSLPPSLPPPPAIIKPSGSGTATGVSDHGSNATRTHCHNSCGTQLRESHMHESRAKKGSIHLPALVPPPPNAVVRAAAYTLARTYGYVLENSARIRIRRVRRPPVYERFAFLVGAAPFAAVRLKIKVPRSKVSRSRASGEFQILPGEALFALARSQRHA